MVNSLGIGVFGGGGGASCLPCLCDVTISCPGANEVLTYCACSAIWVNSPVSGCGAGNVVGPCPASSTDNALVRWNGAGGRTIQNSGITLDDCDNLALGGTLTLGGNITRAADQNIDLTGAATRTLTLLNSTACQVANLDISDGSLLVDTISETTAAAGVTIDGVLLKDGLICACDVPCSHAGSVHHAAVTLAGALDYLTLSGQEITRGAVVLTTDVSGLLPGANLASGLFSKSISVENPTSSEDISIFFTNAAITVSEIRAVLVGSATPSVTWTIRHGTDRSATGAEVVTSGTTTTSTTSGSDVTSFNDATIIADSFVWLETTAQSGTVSEIHITIIYTVD